MEGERDYGKREGRHMQMSTIMKIRSLARAMMKFSFKESAAAREAAEKKSESEATSGEAAGKTKKKTTAEGKGKNIEAKKK